MLFAIILKSICFLEVVAMVQFLTCKASFSSVFLPSFVIVMCELENIHGFLF